MDGFGLEASCLGHTFLRHGQSERTTEGWRPWPQECAEWRCYGSFTNAGAAGHDQHLGHQCESDCRNLAFGKGKADTSLDPWQGPVRIDPRPRQLAICQPHQPFGDGALRAMQAGQKYTRRFANPVGDHRALLKFEIERGADELLRNLEQLLGERH